MIDEKILLRMGAHYKTYDKGTVIFFQDTYAVYYYQIINGEVKMNNYSEDGKEFIQNIFTPGQSFGEPPLFIEEKYPANATAVSDCTLICLEKDLFIEMLRQYPEVSIEMNRSLSRRLWYKSVMAPEISSQDPAKRLLTLLTYFKVHQSEDVNTPFCFQIPMTRQQLADLTGLRVETVIRTIKQLEKEGRLQIKNRKIFY